MEKQEAGYDINIDSDNGEEMATTDAAQERSTCQKRIGLGSEESDQAHGDRRGSTKVAMKKK